MKFIRLFQIDNGDNQIQDSEKVVGTLFQPGYITQYGQEYYPTYFVVLERYEPSGEKPVLEVLK